MPRPHLSDHQKLAQARAEIARLRKVAGAKAEQDATRRKLEGELIKVKLENDRLREQLAAVTCIGSDDCGKSAKLEVVAAAPTMQ